jgi:hypothetical protein
MKGDINQHMLWFIVMLIIVVLLVAMYYFYGYNFIKDIVQKRLLGQ